MPSSGRVQARCFQHKRSHLTSREIWQRKMMNPMQWMLRGTTQTPPPLKTEPFTPPASPKCWSWRLLPDSLSGVVLNHRQPPCPGSHSRPQQAVSSDWLMASIPSLNGGHHRRAIQLQSLSRFSWGLCCSSIAVHLLSSVLFPSPPLVWRSQKHWPTSLPHTNLKDRSLFPGDPLFKWGVWG